MPLETRHGFLADLSTSQAAARSGVTVSYGDRRDKTWDLWSSFCRSLCLDPTLRDIPDPVHLLQVFATRVRDGRLAASGKPVGHGTVSTALRHVGQTLAYMGTPDPRLDSHGAVDLRLKHQLRHYSKIDPPPRRVTPIPIQILRHLAQAARDDPNATESRKAVADLVIIAYYFLMRPGEYCTSSGEDASHPFHTDELELWRGPHQLTLATASDNDLLTATFCILTFSDQKNANRGEKVGHGTSGDPLFCPVRAIARRVVHLRRNDAPAHTPIHCYYQTYRGRSFRVPSNTINLHLRLSAVLLGYDPADTTVKALRATGAMSLITARVDSDLIRLLGRWQSDAMLRYLHVQAVPVLQNFARQMNLHGQFQALPTAGAPIHQPPP
jgi:hypothetical protein